MREHLHARESGQLTEHTSATVGEYLEQWLANQEPTARRTTFRGYKQDLERVSPTATSSKAWMPADAANTVAEQIFKKADEK